MYVRDCWIAFLADHKFNYNILRNSSAVNQEYQVNSYPTSTVIDKNGIIKFLQLLNYVHAIEEQNKQFKEIAWIQSHVVRASLARIVGLIDLFKNTKSANEEEQLIINYLLESAHELDDIIKDITNKARGKLESITLQIKGEMIGNN